MHITMIFLGFVLIQRQRTEQISQIMSIHVTVGRVGRKNNAGNDFKDGSYGDRI